MSSQRIRTVMLQSSTRLDSLGGLYLLQNTLQGEGKYIGIRTAKIEYWKTGTVSLDGKTWRQHLEEGTLLLGVGGGPLDEHASPEFGDRKAEGMSTMMLVAKDLKLDRHPLYRRLIKQVTTNDLKPAESSLDLSNLIKLMHRTGRSQQVIETAFMFFDLFVETQRQFIEALREAENPGSLYVNDRSGNHCAIGLIRSDNEQIWAGFRHVCQGKGQQAAALVQVRSSGRVMIYGNSHKLGVSLKRVAGAIRYHELCDCGRRQDAIDYKDTLEATGQMTLVPNWCYQVPGENLLNGSETAPGLEPTNLYPSFIQELAQQYIEFVELPAQASIQAEQVA